MGSTTTRARGDRSRKAARTEAPLTPSRMAWCTLATSAVRPPSSPSTTYISHNGRSGSSGRLITEATNASSSACPPGDGRLARVRWSSSSKSGSSTHTGWCSPKGTRRARWRNGRDQMQPLLDHPADLRVPRGRREQGPRALGRVEHQGDADVHRRRGGLEREEGGVHADRGAASPLLSVSPPRRHVPVCPKPPLPRSDSPSSSAVTSDEGGLLDPDQDELGDAVAPV